MHYFVSYYDYYQPEAYIPQRDIYIEKDASINDEIDRLRLATTSSLVSRKDCIIIASVSSIYGLGSPEDYKNMMVALEKGAEVDRDDMISRLIDIQYERNDVGFERSKMRVRGDCVEIWPAYEEFAYRIEFWGGRGRSAFLYKPDVRRSHFATGSTFYLSGETFCDSRGANSESDWTDQR